MDSKIENLPLNSPLSTSDAIVSLTEATGLDDQGLLKQMPLLSGHEGTVKLSNISGAHVNRIQVVLEGSDTTYQVDFQRNGAPTISSLEHDNVSDFLG